MEGSPRSNSFLDEDLLSFFDGIPSSNMIRLSTSDGLTSESLVHALKSVNYNEPTEFEMPSLYGSSQNEFNTTFDQSHSQVIHNVTSAPHNLENQSVVINALPADVKVKQEPYFQPEEEVAVKKTEQKKTNARPTKKQKQEVVEVDGKQFIKQFKGMTSDELINYRQNHNLSNTQEKELKSHTRKIKNRESAIQSRQRRKAHQDELEDKMKHLAVENKHLEKEVIKLEAQNEILKKELREFQQMVQQIPGLASLYSLYKTQPLISDPVAVAFTAACATTAAWALKGNSSEFMAVKN
eukprot:TRINITY_DN14633_c0_g1_i1.p1 TRINITY_DN14633_c0_g1~~TRINITY_DN14633_c0_g1_i1.p1  ORF type:complete len:296 (-),score=74.26 TRINITY_DN14633_c0_g1_i1:186-1073(-)